MERELVIMSHDGGVDDYLSVMLLLTIPNVETLGIVVTPADCYIEPAVSATRKILDVMGKSHIPVAESTVRGLNPFPRQYRRSSFQIDNFPILNTKSEIKTPLAAEPGQEWLVRLLREASEPVTFLEIGPFTTLAAALAQAPELAVKIRHILWMGGALNVPGNVSRYVDANVDGSQEWNVYWDPPAAYDIWQTEIPIIMCPLDITNNVPLTAEFMTQLGRQHHHPLSDLAGQCYSLVRHQPYYFWDVLTTCYLGRPDLFTTKEWETVLVPTGSSQGRTKVEAGGRLVTAMETVDTGAFYAYIAEQWAQ